jgi:hypothetical protein
VDFLDFLVTFTGGVADDLERDALGEGEDPDMCGLKIFGVASEKTNKYHVGRSPHSDSTHY